MSAARRVCLRVASLRGGLSPLPLPPLLTLRLSPPPSALLSPAVPLLPAVRRLLLLLLAVLLPRASHSSISEGVAAIAAARGPRGVLSLRRRRRN